ncbi:hypothetical protein HAALTHF_10900n [Vreelandella aquamarina]|nr:hypothetical protein HAALTHF_10900n [Halomonas axialensis]
MRGGALRYRSSAVSRQIALLEEALGATLMERQRDGISPTPVGEMLLEYCERRGALDEGFIASLESLSAHGNWQDIAHRR